MNDLISRKAVLELPRKVVRSFFGEPISETINVKLIEALPTIEPTIIHCSECRHADWRFPGNGLAYCYCMAHSRGGLKGDDYCSYGEKEVAE